MEADRTRKNRKSYNLNRKPLIEAFLTNGNKKQAVKGQFCCVFKNVTKTARPRCLITKETLTRNLTNNGNIVYNKDREILLSFDIKQKGTYRGIADRESDCSVVGIVSSVFKLALSAYDVQGGFLTCSLVLC